MFREDSTKKCPDMLEGFLLYMFNMPGEVFPLFPRTNNFSMNSV